MNEDTLKNIPPKFDPYLLLDIECDKCGGSGFVTDSTEKCQHCGGRGYLTAKIPHREERR